MNEIDDRLAGDLVWELFPARAARPANDSRLARSARWLACAGVVIASGLWSPTLALVMACLAVSAGSFRNGRQLARSIPDKAGGLVCARFTYAWGAWKFSMIALAVAFATPIIVLNGRTAGQTAPEMPPVFVASLQLWAAGYLLSAALTAAGLARAYRYGMRVWVGEGVNRARLLLLGMLLAGFTIGVLGPLGLWLAASAPFARDGGDVSRVTVVVATMLGLIFGGAICTLLVLDCLAHRVVADRPGKFGPKVPAVGKWN
jgi:hypothetical protein